MKICMGSFEVFEILLGLLTHKNIRIPMREKKFRGPPYPPKKPILIVLKAEGHSADTRAGKFPLVSMGGRAEGLTFADRGARTPIGASGIFFLLLSISPRPAW